MGFRCVNCGGNIIFDVDSQSMKCQHCGSMIPPEQFEVKNSSTGEDIAEMQLTLFTCSACGAELQGTEDSQVGFCPYCGGQSLLQSPGGGKSMPERLIPFQVSRDRCADLFKEHTQKVRYLPRELRDAAHLKNFTGIYMPYYEYDVELGSSKITGTKTVESNSRYEIINTYQIDASVSGDYCGVPYDASKYYDDEIAERCLPFDMQKERPFKAAYLSGFYADASTVPADLYYRDAEDTASRDIVDEVSVRVKQQSGIQVEKEKSSIEAHTRGHHSTMFPLWFLTWRKDERVAYAVVNGDSGKVVSDLPVDMKAFSMGCAVLSLVLFILLELMVQPTPLITSIVSLLASVIMAGSIRSSVRRIYEKETHANDKGWSGTKEPVIQQTGTVTSGKKAGRGRKRSDNKEFFHIFSYPLLLIIWLFAQNFFFNDSAMDMKNIAKIISAGSIIFLVATVWKIFNWQKSIPQRQPVRAINTVLGAVILNAAIVFISPVNDFWYYLGDAVCILILIAASVFMLQLYNIGTTRPLPRLFDREEVQ